MSKVYIIEQGNYSDYKVVGIFSTMEKAQQIVAIINKGDEDGYVRDEATIAERELDPFINELNEGLKLFGVVMDYDGTTERCVESGLDYITELRIWGRTSAPAYRHSKINDAVMGDVWARDVAHAVKIVNEFRAQMIASGKMKGWAE